MRSPRVCRRTLLRDSGGRGGRGRLRGPLPAPEGSPTSRPSAAGSRPGAEPLPGASRRPRAPRLGRRRAGKRPARPRAGGQGRALLFLRAQLGRRFRAAAPEPGPQPAGPAGGRRPGDVCAPGGGGRPGERKNGGRGGLRGVRGRSGGRAEQGGACGAVEKCLHRRGAGRGRGPGARRRGEGAATGLTTPTLIPRPPLRNEGST
nr:COMM domain-containing protein 3 isoform X1 [Chlorocebus sabaeus]